MKAVQIVARGKTRLCRCAAARPSCPENRHCFAPLARPRCAASGHFAILHHLPEKQISHRAGRNRARKWVSRRRRGRLTPNASPFAARAIACCVLRPNHRAMCEYYRAPGRLSACRWLPMYKLETRRAGRSSWARCFMLARALPDLRGKSVAVIGQGSAGLWFNEALRWLGRGQDHRAGYKKMYRLAYSRHFRRDAYHFAMRTSRLLPSLREILWRGACPMWSIEAAGEEESITPWPSRWRASAAFIFVVLACLASRTMGLSHSSICFWKKNCDARQWWGAAEDPEHACTRRALDWISRGEVDAAAMITHTFQI